MITAEQLRNKYMAVWPIMLTPEMFDRRYAMLSMPEFEICAGQCTRYKSMIFTDEIEDCDDFANQFYSDFKWHWARWKTDGSFAKEGDKNFIRRNNFPPTIGISFGIKFRGELKKHTVTSALIDNDFYIFDALSRSLYKADPQQDVLLRTLII